MPPRKKKQPPPRPRASSVLRRRRSSLRVPWVLVAAFGILAAALIGLVAFSLRPQDKMGGMNHASLIGSPAPDVSLPLLGGGEFSLADYRGEKNVLVYFNEGHG